jgi:PKD repeat protein
MKIKGLTIPAFVVIFIFTLACKENEDPLVDVNFEYSDSLVLEGTSISFKDLSQGKPTEWSWNFEGGNPEISTMQNPIVTYNNSGEFSVSLFASNRDNSDFKVMNGIIKVFKKLNRHFLLSPQLT